jgi:hypothetical protein
MVMSTGIGTSMCVCTYMNFLEQVHGYRRMYYIEVNET